jgi:hypothetical protein
VIQDDGNKLFDVSGCFRGLYDEHYGMSSDRRIL